MSALSSRTITTSGTEGTGNYWLFYEKAISLDKALQVGTRAGDSLSGSETDDEIWGWNGSDRLFGEGGNDILVGNRGGDLLDGGTGADRMEGREGNDRYVVDNFGTSRARDTVVEAPDAGVDTVRSSVNYTLPANVENLVVIGSAAFGSGDGTGNELANAMTGDSRGNLLKGLAGKGTLKGGGGADTLQGGSGADKIYGGGGNDVLRGDDAGGSKSADRFYFDTALSATNNRDKIEDFDPARDFIHLSKDVFAKAGAIGTLKADAFHTGAAADDAEDRIVYNEATGVLSYDADGTGPTAAVVFATVTPGLNLSNADFIVF